MQTVTTIGLDIAKSVFQVHGIDAEGKVLIRRKLKRRYVLAFFEKLPPCLVGIEACATSHHWSRKLSLPKIISGRIGGAVQPGSEWRGWCQNVGLLDARAHLSVMPSACALDCNTTHKRKELAAGASR
jgi:hypothetical protein